MEFITVIWAILMIYFLVMDYKIQKDTNEIIDEYQKLTTKVINTSKELTDTLCAIRRILVNAEQTKENCWTTLDKIKSELF